MKFALTGAAGYIAPRHLHAIAETGGQLAAALDPSDSVGILDRYFPHAAFFTEFERFDRHLEKRRLAKHPGEAVQYLSICSPNYLHDAHVRLALRLGAHAICEKPLVLNPWNLDALADLEADSPGRVWTLLQLRLHPRILALKNLVEQATPGHRFEVDLRYVTPRGRWYDVSWKGDPAKSGGIAMNIGVHFFDVLLWIFGPVRESRLFGLETRRGAGLLELERARVRWYLSVDADDLPSTDTTGPSPHRAMAVDGERIDFSSGFTDLHTEAYRLILAGKGHGIEAARPSIQLVHDLRHAHPEGMADFNRAITESPCHA